MISKLASTSISTHAAINHKTTLMHYGEIFSLLRKFKKISQKKLADTLNKTQQYISELEHKKELNGNTLDMLLKGINCTREIWKKFVDNLQGGKMIT
jgi:transcriptional regulator with XRE-family HTH domain